MEICSGKAETLAFLVPPEELEARRDQEKRQLPRGSDGDRHLVAMWWGWLRSCGLGRGASTSPVLHFCSEASFNVSDPAFLSVKHFPFPPFFSSNVGYSMLASPCFTSPPLGSPFSLWWSVLL